MQVFDNCIRIIMNYLGLVRLYFCLAVLLSTKFFEVNSTTIYTNTYAVHVEAGKEAADEVAAMHGFINMGEIIDNHFHFIDQRERTKRFVQPSSHRHLHLQSHPHVKWFEQQTVKSRKKRGHLPGDNFSFDHLPGHTTPSSVNFIDPLWKDTWYLLALVQIMASDRMGQSWPESATTASLFSSSTRLLVALDFNCSEMFETQAKTDFLAICLDSMLACCSNQQRIVNCRYKLTGN
ncbi:furin-1-like [Anneissia japonica]|uniref:furin-1-like n=1 Tax=Anneissia japonica TaxID=1529436 RepID=UPI001425AA6A|nr:furin-1-like [Anneissia japonica]